MATASTSCWRLQSSSTPPRRRSPRSAASRRRRRPTARASTARSPSARRPAPTASTRRPPTLRSAGPRRPGPRARSSGSGVGPYTFTVSRGAPNTDGTLTIQIAAGAINDAATNASSASAVLSWTIDTTAPSVTAFSCVPAATPSNSTSFNCSVTFSETPGTNGFDSTTSDVTVGGTSSAWTKGASSGSGVGPYTFTVSRGAPNTDGTLTIQIAAGAINDAATNASSASAVLSWTIDTTAPSVTAFSCVPAATPSNSTSFNCSVTFSETPGTNGFDSTTSDVTVGGTSSAWTKGASSGSGVGPYTFTVSRGAPNTDGTLTIQIAAGAINDAATNASSASAVLSWTIDTTAPSVTAFSCVPAATPSNSTSFNCSVTFSETPGTNGFDSTTSDVTVGGTSSAWTKGASSGSGVGPYTFTVSRGAPNTDGTLTIQIAAGAINDAATNASSASAVLSWTIDTTAPIISLVTPADGSSTNDTTPAFSGTAGTLTGDSATVTVKIYTGASVNPLNLVQTLTATRNGITGAYSVDSAALAEGTYTAQASQSDTAGNTGSSSANTFVVDTTAPIISLVTPADGSSTNDTTPAFSGTAGTLTGDSATVTVKIYTGASVNPLNLVQTLTATRNGITGAYSVDSAALAEGTYTAQASQSDTAGNTGSSSANTFVVDTTAPIISLVTPADGSSTNDTTPAFSGTAGTLTGDSATVTVKIYTGASVNPLNLVQTLTATRNGITGAYSVDSAALAEGTYTAQASQSDTAGNTGSSSANTFVVDTTAPIISLVTPADGSSTNDTTPAFSGTAGTLTGDSATVTVKIYTGASVNPLNLVQTLTATRNGITGAYSVDSAALAEGTYTAQASQSDTAGNTGSSSANTFVVDTTAPIISLVTPADGSSTNDTTPAFSGTAGTLTGDSATVTVKIYTGASVNPLNLVQTLTATRNGITGAYSVDSAALAEGTYTAQASQSDTAGNTGSSSANTFVVDTTAPIISLVTPADGSSTNDTTPAFSGTAGTLTGDSATVTVKIYTGASVNPLNLVQTLTATRNGITGAYSVDSAALAEGTYTAQASQSDTAGNTGSSSANTFVVDTTAPIISLVTPADGSSTNDTTPAFSGTAGTLTGDSATVTVKIYTGASVNPLNLVQTLTATRNGITGAYSVDSAALAEGTYTAQASQSDTAGNTGSSSANTFVVDTTAPIISLVTPADGSSTNDTTPTFSGTAGTLTGDSATVTVKIYTGASVNPLNLVQTLTATRNGITGAYSVDSAALAEGTYTAQAQPVRHSRQHRLQLGQHVRRRHHRADHQPGHPG